MVVATEVRVVSTTGASPVTVTSVRAPATPSVGSSETVEPTVTVTSGTSEAAKFAAEVLTEYLPGGKRMMR